MLRARGSRCVDGTAAQCQSANEQWTGSQCCSVPARRVVAHLEQGCAVIGANRVECWGMAPRFRVLQFDREIVDIGSPVGITDSSPWACVLLRGGEARCFGENWYGGIGIVPNRSGFFEKVDQ